MLIVSYLFAKIGGSRHWFAIFNNWRSPIWRKAMRLCNMALSVWRRHNGRWYRCWQCRRWPRLGHNSIAIIRYATVLLRLAIHDCVAKHTRWRMLILIWIAFGRNGWRFILLNQGAAVQRWIWCMISVMGSVMLHMLLVAIVNGMAILTRLSGCPVGMSVFGLVFGVCNWEPAEQLSTQIFAELPAFGTIADQCDAIIFVES